MHAFVTLKLIEIDPNKIGIYLTETEFYALLIIFVANLIYDYAKDNSEILFSTNEVRFQLDSIVILHIYNIYYMLLLFWYICYFGKLNSWALNSLTVICFQLAENQERIKFF